MIHQCIIRASHAAQNAHVHYGHVRADPRTIIETLRVRNGFTSLRQLAIAAGVSQPTLQRYMKGTTRDLEMENFTAIAHTLGVTVSELLGEVPLSSSQTAREMQRTLAQLDEPSQEQVLRIAKTFVGRPPTES